MLSVAPERKRPSRVIFLDMDGVLCTARAHVAYSSTLLWRHLDPVGVKLLERLCENTDAKLVLSSTWRNHFDQDAMTHILVNAGFAAVPWHQNWKTLKGYTGKRGDEIHAWLEVHRPDVYLILDDDTDMLEHQLPFFVQTHPNDGFLFEHYERAEKILKDSKC